MSTFVLNMYEGFELSKFYEITPVIVSMSMNGIEHIEVFVIVNCGISLVALYSCLCSKAWRMDFSFLVL